MSDQPTNDQPEGAQLFPPYQFGIEEVEFANATKGLQILFQTPYGPHVYHMTAEQAQAVGKRLLEMGRTAAIGIQVARDMPKLVKP